MKRFVLFVSLLSGLAFGNTAEDKAKQVLKDADKNANGLLEKAELVEVKDKNLTEKKFDELDKEKKGALSLEQLTEYYKSVEKAPAKGKSHKK